MSATLTTPSTKRAFAIDACKLALDCIHATDYDGARHWLSAGIDELEKDLAPAFLDPELIRCGVAFSAAVVAITEAPEDRRVFDRAVALLLRALGVKRDA